MSARKGTTMEGPGMAVIAAAWLLLGTTALVAGLRAHGRPRWLRIGRWALALLFVVAGAGVNAYFLATGTDYGGFADGSYLAFVRETWRAVVAPNQTLFIGLLIVFEAAVGTLVLLGGRRAEAGMVLMIGFHVALLSFGWGFFAWSLPMLVALVTLLRAQRTADRGAGAQQPTEEPLAVPMR